MGYPNPLANGDTIIFSREDSEAVANVVQLDRISGLHPGDPGSIPGIGVSILFSNAELADQNYLKFVTTQITKRECLMNANRT